MVSGVERTGGKSPEVVAMVFADFPEGVVGADRAIPVADFRKPDLVGLGFHPVAVYPDFLTYTTLYDHNDACLSAANSLHR